MATQVNVSRKIKLGTVNGLEFDEALFDGVDPEINELFYGDDA